LKTKITGSGRGEKSHRLLAEEEKHKNKLKRKINIKINININK
jgi:mevalonate kinase